jgi:hypothetical protein
LHESFWGVAKCPLYADLGDEGPEGPVGLQHYDAMRNSAASPIGQGRAPR